MSGTLDIAPADLPGFAVALAIGLLLGFERGWRERTAGEGEGDRIAGIRTFALLALAGAALARLLAGSLPALALAALGLAILLAAAQREKVRDTGDSAITTVVAAPLALAAAGLVALLY